MYALGFRALAQKVVPLVVNVVNYREKTDKDLPDIKAKMGVDPEYLAAWWLAHLGDEAIKMGDLAKAKAAAHIIEVQLTSMSKM